VYEVILGSLLIAFNVHACNNKLLDAQAEGCVTRIWSGPPLEKSEVDNKLFFLYDFTKADPKYFQTDSFEPFYDQALQLVQNVQFEEKNKQFVPFAQICRDIYNESWEQEKKIAVVMLLEQVASKYTQVLKKAAFFKH
jgi:hypothetical protein